MVNGTEKAVGETITIDQDLTLTAVWQEQDTGNNPGNNAGNDPETNTDKKSETTPKTNSGANPETPSPSPNPSATPHDTLTKDKRTTDKEKVAPKTGDSMILIVSGITLVATAGGMGLVWKKENE